MNDRNSDGSRNAHGRVRSEPSGRRGRLVAILAGLLLTPVAMSAGDDQPENFLRTVEREDGMRVSLEAAVRAYEPMDGDGPTIFLASAVHIGQESFYRELQAFLDGLDIVLFESVGYEGDAVEVSADERRALVSRSRARWLARLVEEHEARVGRPPATVGELIEGLGADQKNFAPRVDAWGRAMILGVAGEVPFVMSLGADGALEGEGVDADIVASPAYLPAPAPIRREGEGIQQQLADALGLVFQLGAMEHGAANWRNSDMSIEEISRALGSDLVAGEGGEGSTGDALFDLLSGRGFLGKSVGFLLRIVGSNPRLRTVTKAMLVDVIAQADEILKSQQGQLGAMMEVLLEKRNEVVIEDLRALVESGEHRTIGIIYGAGHLPGIERALLEDMRYQRAGARWLEAIEVDLRDGGMSPREAKMMRSMLRRSLDRQLGR